MDKAAIKKFAIWARRKLIEDISQKAYEIGISEKEIKEPQIVSSDSMIIGDRTLTKAEIAQRKSLVARIKEKGYTNVIEEVAYTWFNRFIALRFMEVNEYLPTGVRVLSSTEPGKNEPDIIREALNTDLNLNREFVYQLQDSNDNESLYKYLLIKQCNALNEILPGLFEEIEDYTEILLPSNLLSEGSVIRELVDSIAENNFREQVEIIGWLYQYYISEKKDEVFEGLKKNIKITKENIPAATQLFTPDWVVKYMVENSLGRLWIESHSDDELHSNWQYYLEDEEQESQILKKLEEVRENNKNIKPEDIKVLDPAMGSGHILVYAFDVLFDIYKSAGYSEKDIPRLILQKNLYGLDIDDRAAQLAYFAVMMKARSKSRRIFREKLSLNLCAIRESNNLQNEVSNYFINFEGDGREKLIHEDIEYLIRAFSDAKEYGSILKVRSIDFNAIERRLDRIKDNGGINLFDNSCIDILLKSIPALVKQAKIMSQKYDVIVTNPPYMGSGGMNPYLINYLKANYPNSKGDISTVFMEKTLDLCKDSGYMSMINIPSWMFLSSYEKLREIILNKHTIINMLHFGRGVFGSDFGTTAFIIGKEYKKNYKGQYRRLFLKQGGVDGLEQKKQWFHEGLNIYYFQQSMFNSLPGKPIAYWISNHIRKVFVESDTLNSVSKLKQGLATGNNDQFLKLWHEVDYMKIGFSMESRKKAAESGKKWFPCNKGGPYRRWYGNYDYVVNWENDGQEIRNFKDERGKLRSRPQNMDFYFKKGITWSTLSNSLISFRLSPDGFLFETKGSVCFPDDPNNLPYLFGFLNSSLVKKFITVISPTIDYHEGPVGNLPIRFGENKERIDELVWSNVELARTDWDYFETSWGFKKHPLVSILDVNKKNLGLKDIYKLWENISLRDFHELKAHEEELNRIFIDIYGLYNEIVPEINDEDITIRQSDLARDIKSLISYGVGCMFGRYSLDMDGLAYAGGSWDNSRYKSLIPDQVNVIPITDDEYFEDDIVSRLIEFIKVSFGQDNLEQNLDFIASVLGNSGNISREVIRKYFLKEFYKDHIKTYQKRPIYWLFDSGKQDGFKALIYMHRYDEFNVAKIRTDYLHKLQKAYEAETKRLDITIETSTSQREKANAIKKKEKIFKQMEECLQYDQVLAHVANQRIKIDLDDGVTVNYAKFQGVEIPQGDGKKPLKANLLAKI